MGTVISTLNSSCLPQTANSSSLARRPVPVTRTWIRCPPFKYASDTTIINSWVAGALNSAWRAVENYLETNKIILPSGIRKKFHDKWGKTEYWDEASDEALVKANKDLMKKQIVIGLHEPELLAK